jgi:hypothetical protein
LGETHHNLGDFGVRVHKGFLHQLLKLAGESIGGSNFTHLLVRLGESVGSHLSNESVSIDREEVKEEE